MKKRIVWLVLSFLLVATLVMAAGEKEKEQAITPAAGEPQYGGTLTVWSWSCKADPPTPDVFQGHWHATQFLDPMIERPLAGDFETYGPRGNGESDFQLLVHIPEQYIRGRLLESWEVDFDKVTWHIRPGVYWHDKPDVMGNRDLEVTADDFVADLLYFRSSPPGAGLKEMTADIYATDKYTVVFEFANYDVQLMYVAGLEDRTVISPPETEGTDSWEDQVGTGPFMFKEYVIGSHMAFERNPNYWKTTTINGVEYKLPLIDEVVYPIITDLSTQMAALRTGKLDFHINVPIPQWDTLDSTAPWLLSSQSSAGEASVIALRSDEPPFDDVEVRRAMMIGTDLEACAALLGIGKLPLHFYPIPPGVTGRFVPMEELPAETRLLYDYNPELAMEMLADAGYPDGFEINLYTLDSAADQDRAAQINDQWSKIGVVANIKVIDETTETEMMKGDEKTYHGAVIRGAELGHPFDWLVPFGQTGHFFNVASWSNDRYDELLGVMKSFIAEDKRNLAFEEAGLLMLNEVPYIPTNPLMSGHYWAPWIKNYYGERNMGDNDFINILSHAWLDLDVKKELGFK